MQKQNLGLNGRIRGKQQDDYLEIVVINANMLWI